MDDPKFIQTFKVGDAIPDWLMSITPNKAPAYKGAAYFSMDCYCFEGVKGYYVVPCYPEKLGDTLAPMRLSGYGNVTVGSGGTRVNVYIGVSIFRSDDPDDGDDDIPWYSGPHDGPREPIRSEEDDG